MKKINKREHAKDVPIATEILHDYKQTNKKLFIMIAFLVAIIFLETTYLIILLDSLNTSIGAIREEIVECET